MITLSMIVKNEEKHLRGCLESVKDIIGEIVIVDTGSNDATLEIAKEHQAEIYHFPWNDDFAAARNFALEKSKGEWILYLDADERLSISSKTELKKLVEENAAGKGKRAYQCSIKNIDDFNSRPSTMLYTRLFPNDPKIRFEGAIHEQIENSLISNNYKIFKSGIEIIHIGYSTNKDQLKIKAERNLKILLKEFENIKTAYNAFHIAQSYALLDNKTEALKFFKYALQDKTLKKEYRALAFRYIAIESAQHQDWKKAFENITSSLQSDPDQPLALLAASKIFIKTGNFAEAEKCCRRAYEVNSELISGKRSSYQSIYLDEKDILYHCLNIALSLSNKDLFNSFYKSLKNLRTDENKSEMELLEILLNNKNIDINGSEKLLKTVSDSNLELILAMLNNYPDNAFKIDLLNRIKGNFPGNSIILNKLALSLAAQKRFNEAEENLLKSYDYNPNDPSTVFYLASIFLINNKSEKILPLILNAENTYKNIPEITARLRILKQKLNIN